MKNRLVCLFAVIIWLSVCWGIGQNINKPKAVNTNIKKVGTDSESNQTGSAFVWGNITFDGKKETKDTPWDTTAGIFEMEGEGECILLLANTTAVIDCDMSYSKFLFEYRIHPWMEEVSDGLYMTISVFQNDDLIDEKEIYVSSEDNWKSQVIDVSTYENITEVAIKCWSGIDGSEDGDWLIIRNE